MSGIFYSLSQVPKHKEKRITGVLRIQGGFAALVSVLGYYGWPFDVPENIYNLVETPV